MKKYLALLLIFILVLSCLSLSSCDGESSEATKKPTATGGHTHSGGNASCEAKAVCSVCNKEYGDLAAHSFGDDGLCTVCGAKSPELDSAENDAAQAQARADAVIEKIKALESVSAIDSQNYKEIKARYNEAQAAFSALDSEAMALIGTEDRLTLTGLRALISGYEENLEQTDPLAYYELVREDIPDVQIYKGSLNIDGVMDQAMLDNCTAMTLTKEQCKQWQEEGRKDGADIVGDVSMAADANTEISFYVMYDDEKLYIVEKRCDLTWNFTSSGFSKAYTGDGSIVWFVNISEVSEWISKGGSIEGGDAPACGIMWNAGIDNAVSGENVPQMALFPKDDQTSPTHKSVLDGWSYVLKWDSENYYYVLEVAIPWRDLPFTAEDLEAGNIAMTFCSVDIVNSEFNGDPGRLWSGMGYQMQYPGVNNWCWSESLVVKK